MLIAVGHKSETSKLYAPNFYMEMFLPGKSVVMKQNDDHQKCLNGSFFFNPSMHRKIQKSAYSTRNKGLAHDQNCQELKMENC